MKTTNTFKILLVLIAVLASSWGFAQNVPEYEKQLDAAINAGTTLTHIQASDREVAGEMLKEKLKAAKTGKVLWYVAGTLYEVKRDGKMVALAKEGDNLAVIPGVIERKIIHSLVPGAKTYTELFYNYTGEKVADKASLLQSLPELVAKSKFELTVVIEDFDAILPVKENTNVDQDVGLTRKILKSIFSLKRKGVKSQLISLGSERPDKETFKDLVALKIPIMGADGVRNLFDKMQAEGAFRFAADIGAEERKIIEQKFQGNTESAVRMALYMAIKNADAMDGEIIYDTDAEGNRTAKLSRRHLAFAEQFITEKSDLPYGLIRVKPDPNAIRPVGMEKVESILLEWVSLVQQTTNSEAAISELQSIERIAEDLQAKLQKPQGASNSVEPVAQKGFLTKMKEGALKLLGRQPKPALNPTVSEADIQKYTAKLNEIIDRLWDIEERHRSNQELERLIKERMPEAIDEEKEMTQEEFKKLVDARRKIFQEIVAEHKGEEALREALSKSGYETFAAEMKSENILTVIDNIKNRSGKLSKSVRQSLVNLSVKDMMHIMVTGLQGTGKTTLVQSMANLLQKFGVEVYIWDLASMPDKYSGGGEEKVENIDAHLQTIHTEGRLAIVAMDEATEALREGRSEDKQAANIQSKLKNIFTKNRIGIFFVALGNGTDGIAGPVMRRFKNVFGAYLPGPVARKAIIESLIPESIRDGSWAEKGLDEVVAKSKRFLPFEIAEGLSAIKREAIRIAAARKGITIGKDADPIQYAETVKIRVSVGDLLTAFKKTPSILNGKSAALAADTLKYEPLDESGVKELKQDIATAELSPKEAKLMGATDELIAEAREEYKVEAAKKLKDPKTPRREIVKNYREFHGETSPAGKNEQAVERSSKVKTSERSFIRTLTKERTGGNPFQILEISGYTESDYANADDFAKEVEAVVKQAYGRLDATKNEKLVILVQGGNNGVGVAFEVIESLKTRNMGNIVLGAVTSSASAIDHIMSGSNQFGNAKAGPDAILLTPEGDPTKSVSLVSALAMDPEARGNAQLDIIEGSDHVFDQAIDKILEFKLADRALEVTLHVGTGSDATHARAATELAGLLMRNTELLGEKIKVQVLGADGSMIDITQFRDHPTGAKILKNIELATTRAPEMRAELEKLKELAQTATDEHKTEAETKTRELEQKLTRAERFSGIENRAAEFMKETLVRAEMTKAEVTTNGTSGLMDNFDVSIASDHQQAERAARLERTIEYLTEKLPKALKDKVEAINREEVVEKIKEKAKGH